MKISKQQASAELARRSLRHFTRHTAPELKSAPFHERYYKILDAFARGRIRRLIVSMPPQHGKSTGSSCLLPAYMLGLNPSLHVAVASYNFTLASKFNRKVQRIIDSPAYRTAFPATRLKGVPAQRSNYVRTNEEFDIVGQTGGLIAVGREGALTGNAVDIFIMDDLYKDALEANSPLIRDNTWDWYNSVVRTRLHNDSRELIVFTRWHEDDLIGRLEKHEPVMELTCLSQIGQVSPYTWVKVNYEAIKTGKPYALDPRASGEALWPDKHSVRLLEEKRRLDPFTFETMYQGKPATREGLLYGDQFITYKKLPENTVRIRNYTDTADTGDDFLCSVCYEVDMEGLIYVTDMVYSPEPMEVTESRVAEMFVRNKTRTALIESNNGGRGFARAVGQKAPEVRVEWFHQSRNKEARILSNSATVLKQIRMPEDWYRRWSEFYNDITTYRRLYRTNRRHDGPDVLTGIIETETAVAGSKKIKAMGFRV